MANIVITTDSNNFTVISNVYLNAVGSPKVTMSRRDIEKVYFNKESTYIVVEIKGIQDFLVSPTTVFSVEGKPITVVVDSIDALPMTTLEEIYQAFSTLKNV
jgi:hypothetical protein